MMTLLMINEQGANEETGGLETMDDVRAQINTWSDPENMTAHIWDSETGEEIYNDQASKFLE